VPCHPYCLGRWIECSFYSLSSNETYASSVQFPFIRTLLAYQVTKACQPTQPKETSSPTSARRSDCAPVLFTFMKHPVLTRCFPSSPGADSPYRNSHHEPIDHHRLTESILTTAHSRAAIPCAEPSPFPSQKRMCHPTTSPPQVFHLLPETDTIKAHPPTDCLPSRLQEGDQCFKMLS
jgi:hypothetical protein